MRKGIFAVLAMAVMVCSGCATGRTVTYQTTEWREVEESAPTTTRVVQADIPQVFPGAVKGRKYLNIGYKPVNPNRALAEGEVEFILPADANVTTVDRDGKRSTGPLIASSRVVGVATSNPDYYKAMWIRQCGNPILNEEGNAIFFRVRRETVSQPSTKRWVQETVDHTRPATCVERKSGWGQVIGGVIGLGGGLFTRNKAIAAGMAGGGSLIGSFIDGGCIEPTEVLTAGGFAAAGYVFTKGRSHQRYFKPMRKGGGPVPLPPNGPTGPGPLPINGPAGLPGS